jgi:thiamine biosynthesis lipoprotein
MGTSYTIKIVGLPKDADSDALHKEITGILERINARMSTYRKDSELSRFNRQRSTEWFDVSSETVFVVDEAQRVSRLSQGAFDVTVGPLVNLWGFGPAPRREELPTDGAIEEALQSVGYEKVHTRSSPPAVRKDHPEIQIDLSAIAKGYAVDRVADHLKSRGIASYMVEIGGEVHAQGRNAQGSGWRIGIETPVANERSVQKVIHLQDRGMAISGDYRNYFEKDGKRFSHTINPRTGKPITHTLASVAVLQPTSMAADALATALMVMGPDAGYELAARESLPALFISKRPDGFEEKATPEFEKFFRE